MSGQLCRIDIGPKDRKLPATCWNVEIKINGRVVKVHRIEFDLNADDPEDPMCRITMPADIRLNGIEIPVVAEGDGSAQAPVKKPRPIILSPCTSCGIECEGDHSKWELESVEGDVMDLYCGVCGPKVEAIRSGKAKVVAASGVHGNITEGFEGDPVE